MSTFRSLFTYQSNYLVNDISAGLSVFLVALPLCLGIALASGAPLFAGLVAGVVGGIVVGFLSGSEVSVSGPAAGLAVIVADSIAKLGSYEVFLVAVVLAGVFQLGLGVLKAGRFGSFFPDAVIKGLLVAIGIVIILKQIPHALGRDNDYEGEFEFSQLADQENTLSEIYRATVTASPGAIAISLASLAVLLLWDRWGSQGKRFFQTVPAALVVVLLGVGLNQLFYLLIPGWYLGDSNEHMVRIPSFKPGQSTGAILDFPTFSAIINPRVIVVALTLMLVASLETLLNLEASDRLDPRRRVSSPDQELVAQGVGNILSGLLGGLPVTSVVIRTSANIFGGSRTRISTILHGFLLLTAVLLVGSSLNHIPLSCLAALLIVVGYKLAKPSIFMAIFRDGWNQFIPFIVTVLCIVFTDLLIGIAVGTVVGVLFVLYANAQSTFHVVRDENRVLIKFQKDMNFLNKPRLKEALRELQPGDQVLVDGRHASFIDHDIYNMLVDYAKTASAHGVAYELQDVSRRKRQLPTSQLHEVIQSKPPLAK